MKTKQTALLLASIMMLSLSVSNSFPKDSHPDFYTNPYLLNGKAVDFAQLSSINIGKLSIVKTNPESNQKMAVPFYAYIRRNGKIIDAESYAHNHAVKEVEISKVIKSSRPGDELVIDPASKNNGVGQRSVILKQKQLVPHFQWFFVGDKSKEGC